jgi:hypothetical protein
MAFKKMTFGVGLAAVITVGMFATTGSALAATNDYLKTFYASDHWTAAAACNSYADYANKNWTGERHSWGDWFYCANGPAESSANLWVRRADS